ncbi:hypothetical protein FFLO_07100 [Filobasidium floriforme]|uniref:Uncharacterized protein n=1 Tax=Filobasidium floriforme TaxID=5210 RepID=A0A8K0JDY7_9TREE|nr:uncharacterized protein HD553DRAFT_342687 [Filobasidium floriforme]KAG7527270.1 hypothetical protein FFLO_07100 [Filobasidium floriforme]KAH8084285.1 hypothetical protein HD553DRAFT_342687 [Filobasidium floriforme]
MTSSTTAIRTTDPMPTPVTPSTPSPPKPVPALHGSLSLPYARNPSGTDSVINDPRQTYLSQVWGVKTKPRFSGITTASTRSHPHSGMDQARGIAKNDAGRIGDWGEMRKESKENQPIPNDTTAAHQAYSQRDTGSAGPLVVEDPDQVIGRKSNSRHQQKAFVRQPPIISTSTFPQPLKTAHSKSTSLSLRAETMSPIESGSDTDSDRTPTRPTFDLARQSQSYSSLHTYSSTGERPAQKEKEDYNPVLSALAFQSRLLSPDPKPRIQSQTQTQTQSQPQFQSQPRHTTTPTTTTPPRPNRSASTSGSHTIDGYGPPQPPTVSPVSAERKAAIAAAERRRSLQGQGNGSPGRRAPGSPGRYDGSPGRPSPSRDTLAGASRGRVSLGVSATRTPEDSLMTRSPGNLHRSDEGSPFVTSGGGSWASRTTTALARDAMQQKGKAFAHLSPRREIVADTSRDDPEMSSQAKMRYSPKRGQWVAAGKQDDEQDGNKALSTDNLSADKQPIKVEMETTTSTAFLGHSPSASKVEHSARNPFDFTFLQPVPTTIPVTSSPMQTKQQAGLGLGRPGLGKPKRNSSGTAANDPSAAQDSPRDKRRMTSSENESLAGVFPTLFISKRGGPANNQGSQTLKSNAPSRPLASSALSHGEPMPNPFLSPPSTTDLVERLEPGRRVVSEPIPIIDAPAEAVATGFANFISNSRIVSDPTPLPKLQQNVNNATRKRNRNKQAKKGFPNPEPVVHNWTSLKEKFEFPTLPVASGSGSKNNGGDDKIQLYDTKSDMTERPIFTKPDTNRKPTITKPALNEKQPRPDDTKPKTKLALHDSLPGSNVTHSQVSSAARHQRDEPPHTRLTNSYENKITQNKLKNDSTYKHTRSPYDDNDKTQTTDGTAKSDQDHINVPAARRGSDSQARDRKRVDKVNSTSPSAWIRAKQQPAEQSPSKFAGHIYDVSSTGHTLI